MIFKIIISNQEDKMKGFTFRSESHHDVQSELEGFFINYTTKESSPNGYRIILYTLTMPNEGEGEDSLIDNLTNPNNQEFCKEWFITEISFFENDLVSYLEERSVFSELGF